jgi:hypothetical protein
MTGSKLFCLAAILSAAIAAPVLVAGENCNQSLKIRGVCRGC